MRRSKGALLKEDVSQGEKHDVFTERRDDAKALYRELLAWKAQRKPVTGEAPPAVLDKEQIEKLRALGYIR